jgi:hypothetical protein
MFDVLKSGGHWDTDGLTRCVFTFVLSNDKANCFTVALVCAVESVRDDCYPICMDILW